MITQDKVIEIYSMADDFCKFFSSQIKNHLLEAPSKTRKYHRDKKMSDAEIITIMVLFHMMGYRCLKHFYLNHVCTHMRDMFPNTVSYNRFVELQQSVMLPLTIFVKEVLLGKCTGIMKNFLMSSADKILLRKRAVIETINDELKNICQIEHSRHRCFANFVVNLLSGLAAYCFFPKKPSIKLETDTSNQLTLF